MQKSFVFLQVLMHLFAVPFAGKDGAPRGRGERRRRGRRGCQDALSCVRGDDLQRHSGTALRRSVLPQLQGILQEGAPGECATRAGIPFIATAEKATFHWGKTSKGWDMNKATTTNVCSKSARRI